MKRMLALLLCLAMLLSYVPSMLFSASADGVDPEDSDISVGINPDDVVPETTAPAETEPVETEPEATTEETTTAPEVTERVATCAACGEEVVWQPITGRINSTNGTHFYLTENYTYAGTLPVISVEAGASVCVDLNGHNLTTATEINVKGVLNIQGEGSVGGNIGGVFGNGSQPDIDFDDLINAGQGGETVAYDTALINIAAADAVVNVYGGTYSVVNDKPIVAYTEAGSLNLLGGKVDGTIEAGMLTLGGAAEVTLIEIPETGKLTVKADWTGSAVVNFAAALVEGLVPAANGAAQGDFKGSLKTINNRNIINDNGSLRVKILANNPVQEAALDMVFPTDGSDYVAMCPACGKEVTWKAVTSGRILDGDQTSSHFYLAKSYTVTNNNGVANLYGNATDTMCIHLNGKTLDGRGGINAQRGIMNFMGEGVVKTDGTCTGSDKEMLNTGVVLVNMSGAVVNLYGGNYRPYENTTYAVNFLKAGSLNIYEGVAIEGKVNAPVGSLNIEKGTIYGVQGENITWTFADGDLTISGTGVMTSGVEGTNVSWYAVNGSVKNFYIPAGITGMDDSALAGTTILEAIHVDAENTVYSSADGILYDKAQTTMLMVPGNLSGEITIPATVTTIDEAAFFNASLLTAINVDPANENYSSVDGVLFNKAQTELIRFPAMKTGTYSVPETVTTIAPYAFAYCEGLTEIIVPDSVTEIGEYAFRNAILLENLTLSKNITAIPDYMCAGCTALTTVEVPDGVTYIGTYAYSKASIAEATIPASVTEIGKGAFRYCPLTDVYYGSTQEDWDAISYEPTVMSGFTDELVAATKHYYEPAAVLTGITVTAPTKVEYELGEELALDGMIVTGTYSDETIAPITEGYEVSGFDSETAGVKIVTVTFEGFTATFEVTVKEAPVVLTGITVTAPTKVEYELGEELALDGMTVTGTYSNETTAPISEGFTVTGFESETAGVKTITVTYGEFTATFEVTVKEAPVVLTGIAVTKLPTKVTYMAGASFDAKGMVVTATYSDGTTAAITDYTVDADLSTAGTKTVTITSGECTATFTVEVLDSVVIPITAVNTTKGIKVSWTNVGADTMKLYERHLEDGEWTEWTFIAQPTGTSSTHSPVTLGVTYEYKLVAQLSGMVIGEAYSEAITRIGATTITAKNVIEGVQITWDENPAADAYYVYSRVYTDNVAGAWEKIGETTEAGYMDTKAKNGVKVDYMVRALSGGDLAAEDKPLQHIYLRVVTDVYSIENTISTITIRWKGYSSATKYFIHRSELKDGEWTAWKQITSIPDVTNLVYNDYNVTAGVKYRYAVVAYRGGFYSAVVEGAEYMRLGLSILSCSNQVGGMRVYWTANKHAEKYRLYRSEYKDGEWTPWGQYILETTDLEYFDTTVVNGVRYRYTVRIMNGSYISGYKAGTTMYYLEAPYSTLSNSVNGIELSWTSNPKAQKYYVYRSEKKPGDTQYSSWTFLTSRPASQTSHTDNMVENGVTYRYRVTTAKDGNESYQRVSRSILKITYQVAPGYSAGTNGVTITPKTNNMTKTFVVERRVKDVEAGTYGAWEELVTTSEASYLDTTAEKGVTYQYRTRPVVGTEIGAGKATADIVAKTTAN